MREGEARQTNKKLKWWHREGNEGEDLEDDLCNYQKYGYLKSENGRRKVIFNVVNENNAVKWSMMMKYVLVIDSIEAHTASGNASNKQFVLWMNVAYFISVAVMFACYCRRTSILGFVRLRKRDWRLSNDETITHISMKTNVISYLKPWPWKIKTSWCNNDNIPSIKINSSITDHRCLILITDNMILFITEDASVAKK